MDEKRTPLRPIKVEMPCECGNGMMEHPTDTLMAWAPGIHLCTAEGCRKTLTALPTYPRMEYEPA